MTQYNASEPRKQYAVLFGIHANRSNTNISMHRRLSDERFLFILMKTKHSVHIMMFRVFTSNDDVIPSSIVPHGFTLNTESYFKCLYKVVLSCTERVASRRPYVCQHDTATCCTSREPSVDRKKISAFTSP